MCPDGTTATNRSQLKPNIHVLAYKLLRPFRKQARSSDSLNGLKAPPSLVISSAGQMRSKRFNTHASA